MLSVVTSLDTTSVRREHQDHRDRRDCTSTANGIGGELYPLLRRRRDQDDDDDD